MAFPLSVIHSDTGKDLVVKALSNGSSLSAKKIHRELKERFNISISYQAVHKTLRLLVEDSVVKKFEKEYYLNQEWIDSVHSFITNLKNRKGVTVNQSTEPPSINYAQSFAIQPIRFIPFFLGTFTLSLPKNSVPIEKSKEKIVFKWRGRVWTWYDTGVAVLAVLEEEKQYDAVQFLVERRKTHLGILNHQHRYTLDILDLIQLVNPSGDPQLCYVMSIHGMKKPENSIRSTELLQLLLHPNILSIPDNPKVAVGDEHVKLAQQKLAQLTTTEGFDTYEIQLSGAQKIFASWSNVIFYNDDQNISAQLIQQECELQHLWYYFHLLKNELRRAIRKGERKELKRLLQKRGKCLERWHQFENIGAMEDDQLLLIKEGLIKTSRIEKVYHELQRIFLYGERELKND